MGLGFDELLGLGSEFSGQFRLLQEGEELGLEVFHRVDAEGASEFDHFFGFQGIVVMRAEEDGQAHRGRFHGVMNAGGESRTDVSDVGSTVEPCEQADGVDEQDPQSRRGLVPVFQRTMGMSRKKVSAWRRCSSVGSWGTSTSCNSGDCSRALRKTG